MPAANSAERFSGNRPPSPQAPPATAPRRAVPVRAVRNVVRTTTPVPLNYSGSLNTRPNAQLILALATAIALHALMIFGVGFDFEPPTPHNRSLQKLEVTVIRTPANHEAPDNPDFAAQSSQTGGGVQEEKILPTPKTTTEPVHNPEAREGSPLPPVPTQETQEASPSVQAKAEKVPQPNKERQSEVLTAKPKALLAKKRQSEPVQTRLPSASDILNSRTLEATRLTQQVEERSNAYAKRPRRKVITASTKEFKYASYLEAWKRKVEQVGNLNFPEEARQKKVYGNLVLHVALKADGTVETVRLVYSSGHKVLDEAAEHIVRMAAPFAPFPENIRRETDVLDIIRTWQFLSTNRFSW